MPSATYIPMANITLGSSAASVTFSSISQAYRDLVLVMEAKTSVTANVNIRFNSDDGSSTKYNRVDMRGDGSSATSTSGSGDSTFNIAATPTSTVAAHAVLNILDYSATNKHKPALMRSGKSDQGTYAFAVRWADTSAITAIVLFTGSGTFTSGSTFALYGVAA